MRQRNHYTTPPQDGSYHEWLRYLVQSSDPSAGELPFLISMWMACINAKGLTPLQAEACQPYFTEAREFLEANVYLPELEDDRTNVVDLWEHRK